MASTTYDADRAVQLRGSLEEVNARVATAAGLSATSKLPILVAVSKLKPASDILGCYDAGHREFGENYVDELLEKATELPSDIRWHFIGTLQSNKAKVLASIPNLHLVQTLTSAKAANALDRSLPANRTSPLNVMLQVNTSGETSKSGLAPLHIEVEEDSPEDSMQVLELAKHIVSKCKRLHLLGVMTIGSYEASVDDTKPNPDFETLKATRDALELKLSEEMQNVSWGNDGRLLLSMGMSSDFESAIRAGSDIVRVGTSIFGLRLNKVTTP